MTTPPGARSGEPDHRGVGAGERAGYSSYEAQEATSAGEVREGYRQDVRTLNAV